MIEWAIVYSIQMIGRYVSFRFGTGAAGPAFFGMGVKQSLIILLIVDLLYVGYVASISCSVDDFH